MRSFPELINSYNVRALPGTHRNHKLFSEKERKRLAIKEGPVGSRQRYRQLIRRHKFSLVAHFYNTPVVDEDKSHMIFKV